MADFAKSLFHFPFHSKADVSANSSNSLSGLDNKPEDAESNNVNESGEGAAATIITVDAAAVAAIDQPQQHQEKPEKHSKFPFFGSRSSTPKNSSESSSAVQDNGKPGAISNLSEQLPSTTFPTEANDQRRPTPQPDLIDKRVPPLQQAFADTASPPDSPSYHRHVSGSATTESSPPSSASSFSNSTTITGSNIPTTSSTPVNPPRGRLIVKIVQAKNLRVTSRDALPYVVCTFESNEFITHGPSFSEPQDSRITSFIDRSGLQAVSGSGLATAAAAVAAAASSSSLSHTITNGIAIPSRSRQSSTTNLSEINSNRGQVSGANPSWTHEAVFDVLTDNSEIDVSIYDQRTNDSFLGHVRFTPVLRKDQIFDEWYKLQPRVDGEQVSGEVRLQMLFETIVKRPYGPDDFEILRLVGKGTFGQVYQVRKKDTGRIYAMKVLSKKVIVQKKEVAHTIGERNILVRTATTDSPFIVGLKFSFQTPTDLYLVTDYMSGGELFWHLQKEGRFSERRAKFYIAELILALEHLHNNGIVYRDLKPENILLDANGHVALCDFGLSKANLSSNDTTNTFCGTTEYLAPEVLLDEQGYTKMVDFWSLGVLIFEMCCGWSPFYAEDTQQMYKNIAFGKVRFPKDALSANGKSFVKGLLNRNPKHRLGAIDDARELRAHPFFNDIDWDLLLQKKLPPPFKPHLTSETDTSNFDPEFTNASTSALQGSRLIASTPLSPTMQANFQGFTFVDESSIDDHFKDHKLPPMDEEEDEFYFHGRGRLDRHDTSATLTDFKNTSSAQGNLSTVAAATSSASSSSRGYHDDGDIDMDLGDDCEDLTRQMSGIENVSRRYSYEEDGFVNGQPIDI
ncbi:kinase-like domain-containing protein [Lipomyces japonicus]|uniref:kinase-like domain-containing protein n=1 Tax=Lipomyces japonicus TaxID=56871 RepID=UPI0034CD68D1